jgi:glycosyltransferase involved in cell wall biosynthesis
MEKPKISVIVPIYNTQKYINKCINSILNQTYKDFELLLVVDGSPDNCLEICNNYAKKDKRIIVINKENEGLEKTRRVGLSYAKGEYITHIDSDDWVEVTALEKMITAAQNSNADIVIAKFFRVMDKFGLIKKPSPYNLQNNLIVEKDVFMKDYFINFFGVNKFSVSMWAKLFKKSFLNNIDIAIGGFDMGEDLYYNIQVFPKATKIHFIDAPIYFYRFGGMTTKLNEKIIEAAIGMYKLKKETINLYDKPEYLKYMVIEMINYLKSYIKMLIEYKNDDKIFIKNTIEKLLIRKEIQEVILIAKDDNYYKDDEFVNALVQKNTNQLIDLQTKIYNKEKFKKSLKRWISNLLK